MKSFETMNGKNKTEMVNVQFQVHLNGEDIPSNKDRNSVWLIGASPAMGDWIPANAIPMTRIGE